MSVYISEDILKDGDVLDTIINRKQKRIELCRECNYLVVSQPVYSYLSKTVVRKYGNSEYPDIKVLFGLEVIVLDSNELILAIG